MNEFYTDVGYGSMNKLGEELCGDHVELAHDTDGATILVLADGLGSGVKANILSILTSKILSTMMANHMGIEECVLAMAQTLPVCEVWKIAYSTFTIIRITEGRVAEIIRYDNPQVILLREGIPAPYPERGEWVGDKMIYRANIPLLENDTFIAVSDGVIHAGVGKSLNFGWQLEQVTAYLEAIYLKEHTAKTLATLLLEQCGRLYEGEPGDDTTVCALKVRRRQPVNLAIGPPQNPQDDIAMMSLFFSKEGKHIVCGGTTSSIAADYLGKPVVVGAPKYQEKDIPPTATIEGVDLVTEGVITFNKVLYYARDFLDKNIHHKDWSIKKDGASQVARLLFEEATDINFYVGRAVNTAHMDPALPISFHTKMQLVEELEKALSQMGKNIKVSYF